MHTTKIFIKKNKIGNYLKHAREHYIRDDIYCGFEICDKCTRATTSLSSKHVNKCGLIKNNHYLILDTNVILDQIDVLEENLIGNVIILNTVLKEVKHRNMPIYKRLISIIENPSRHFYIFINDYNKGTYLKQELTELINDYNDRCIRKACSWYIEHIPDENFVLLTEDKNNRRIAQEENIPAYSSKYNIQGVIIVIIRGYSNLNRVIDGDVVAIEVFDKDQWVSPSELVLEDDTINALDDNLERKELEISKQRTLKKNIKPTGRIVGIIKRKWRQYCGILQEGSAAVYHLFLPADRKIPKIRIETRQAETLKTQKIIVAIDSWPRIPISQRSYYNRNKSF
ncbi:ribonuclease [Holotrichia oblita]|uniref:Ribonuclease n=1 Tax=Holotrichia oblita TaxID=644536 RepID=A0ACB9TSB7_HOLOL|nr:ribonuclease [Holotrichia oblita]